MERITPETWEHFYLKSIKTSVKVLGRIPPNFGRVSLRIPEGIVTEFSYGFSRIPKRFYPKVMKTIITENWDELRLCPESDFPRYLRGIHSAF